MSKKPYPPPTKPKKCAIEMCNMKATVETPLCGKHLDAVFTTTFKVIHKMNLKYPPGGKK